MTTKEQIEVDLKRAMLAGDKVLTTTLRGLKSAILYVEVANGSRETGGLSDEEVTAVFTKEAKKRQESADLFAQGGNQEKAEAELAEKAVIQQYLPEQVGEEDIIKIVDQVITETGASGMQAMGQVMGAVKQQTGAGADGALVAKLVKERLS